MELLFLGNALAVSIVLNVWLYHQIKKSKNQRPESLELREFLSDLTSGRALVKVERVDPASVFIHHPKDI